MEKGHVPIKRGVSWSPGGLRKPLQLKENSHIHEEDYNASWEKTGLNKEHVSRKTNLSRSASLSEKELREARVRSHIIAAQLTIPSNPGSCSRGVQLFNRRRQRVNAFTLESCGRGSEQEKDGRNRPSTNILTWTEKSSEDKERQNYKNFKPLLSPTISEHSVDDIMNDQAKDLPREEDLGTSVIQERHFLPVKEVQEDEEEAKDDIAEELENVKHRMSPVVVGNAEKEAGTNQSHSGPVAPGKLPNGCYSTSRPEMMPSASSMHTTSIINRTARPFFSPTTVQSHEVKSPIMDIPSPPSYSTPPLPAPMATEHSPLPPAPTYPTPPLPMFTKQSQPSFYSSPPPLSPTMSCSSPVPSHLPTSQYPPVSHCAPPTAPKPSTFVPVSTGDRKQITPIKTGILEDGAARRATKKTMFTFKEKQVVAPNPELLSLVQGVDERKKHGNRSVLEPASEEELLALGAEASNFLSKEEDKAKGGKAPEWASCLKSSRTRPKVEHQPEQTLTNVSGKGAELFAKRQSRMEKYVIEDQKTGQMRSPSPTMSLPPSWVYPSNMPGRVKAIAKNSDMSVQLSQNLKAQQEVRQKPRPKAVAPEPVPEPPQLENGCSKIEMDLSRHRPYQLNSSLFTFNPVKDPVSTLPRGAPRTNNLVTGHALSRQTSLPSPSPTHFTLPLKSAQLPFSLQKAPEHLSNPDFGTQRISSPMSPISPEKASSTQSAVQAPRPTFSAKKAGITPQVSLESPSGEMTSETSTFTSISTLPRHFSSPATGIWSSSPQTNKSSSASSGSIRPLTSHATSPSIARFQSNTNHQDMKFPTSTSNASATPTSPQSPWSSRCQSPMVSPPVKGHSPVSPPWSSRCQSPMASQNSKPSAVASCSISRPSLACTDTFPSPPWESGGKATLQSHNTQSPALSISTSRPSQTSASPVWGSRSQSPAPFHRSSISPPTKNLTHTSSAVPPSPQPTGNCCMSPISNNLDSRANHRLLAKNIINAAKRKNSPSPGALSGHSLPISPLGNSPHDCHKPPFHSRALGAQSPVFTSPPPTQRICSPVRFYNSRSLTDSDASIESEDSGLRSPGLHSYNTCPRGWGGSLRVKRSTISTDL